MIISRGRNFIFVHAPKTGGTSLALALESRAMKDDIMLGDTPKATKRRRRLKDVQAAGRLWKHSTLADIDGLIRHEEIEQMFTFMLVRNPWDRMVSYYHWLKVQSFDHPAVLLAKSNDFEGFVRARETQTTFKAWPMARYMRDAGGTGQADLFIRLEHFEQDAQPLFDHLGFVLELPHANRSDQAMGITEHYTEELKEIVAEACASDIEKFDYKFPLSGSDSLHG